MGPFGISPVPLLAVLLVGSLAWAIARARRGEDLRPRFSMSSLRRAVTWKPRTVRGWIPVWGFYLVFFGVLTGTIVFDPIRYGSVYGPGPEVDEVTAGGHWYDEAAGDIVPRPAAPEYVFRVSPGDAFSVILSVRNVWPIPITVLGLVQSPGQATPETLQGNDAAWNGLGLLRDPAVVSALPQDVVPFHPVNLLPGQEVTLVLAYVAGECADPTAGLPVELPYSYNPGISLVYDVFGWRAVGRTYPPFDQAIPVREGCMRAGS